MSLRNDIMRFSVLGFQSDIRIELAPVVQLTLFACELQTKWDLTGVFYYYDQNKLRDEYDEGCLYATKWAS